MSSHFATLEIYMKEEQTATCHELRVYVTVANIDGEPEYSAEDIAESVMNCLRRCPGGCGVEIVESTVVSE